MNSNQRPAPLPLLLCLLAATAGRAQTPIEADPVEAKATATQAPPPATAKASEATPKSPAEEAATEKIAAEKAAASAAQQDRKAKEALIQRVAKAHRPKGPTKAITAFRCDLVLHVLDKRLQEGGQVELGVQYLEYEMPLLKSTRSLLRYEQRDAETPIVRGEDKFGPWHLSQGKPVDLTGAEAREDLKAFRQHQNLARQLVRFLSPEQVLRSLSNTGPVGEHKLRLTRTKSIETLTIQGDIKKFPIMQMGGGEVPARMTVYIDKASARLVAIDVAPLKDGVVQTQLGERCWLKDLQARNDLLIPLRLVYWRNTDGKPMIHSEVKLTTIDLRPGLTPDDFTRK